MSQRTNDPLQIELSGKQESRLISQLSAMYEKVQPWAQNESRHEDKQNARAQIKAETGNEHPTKRMEATITKVHSYGTQHKIQGEAKMLFGFCFQHYNIKDIGAVKPEHVKEYFLELGYRGYAFKTIESKISSVYRIAGMLDKHLDTHNRQKSWGEVTNYIRDTVLKEAPKLNEEGRAYDNPHKIVDSIQHPRSQLIASLQLNHGLRLSDACKLREIHENGMVANSKGGQPIPCVFSEEEARLYAQLKDSDIDCSRNSIKSKYVRELKKAVEACGEQFAGKATHGFRHNFAQYHYFRFRTQGMTAEEKEKWKKLVDHDGPLTHDEALLIVSRMMGHKRPEITLQYLR